MSYNTVPSNINNTTLFRDWLNTINAALNEERLLWNEVNLKAPKSHSSIYNIYGVGDDTKYGHLMLTDTPSEEKDITKGTALTPKALYDANLEIENQINDLTSELNSLSSTLTDTTSVIESQLSAIQSNIESTYAQIYHASETTDYGLGTSTLYGHLKLSDVRSSSLDENSGTAITPKALDTALTEIENVIASIQSNISSTQSDMQNYSPIPHNSVDNRYGVGDETNYGHIKITTNYTGIDFSSTEVNGNNATEKFITNDNWSFITSTDIAPSINFLHDFYSDLTTVFSDLNTRIITNSSDINAINENIDSVVSTITLVQSSLAEKYHASETTDYGIGTTDLYGHLKITDNFQNNVEYDMDDPTAVSASAFHNFLHNETTGYNNTISSINSNISAIQSQIGTVHTDTNGNYINLQSQTDALDDRISELENNPAISNDTLFFDSNITISNPTYSTYICNDANSNIIVTVSDVQPNIQFTVKNETNYLVNVVPFEGYTIDKTEMPIVLGKNDSVTLKQNEGENDINFTVISSNVQLSHSEHVTTNGETITVSMSNRKANYFEISNPNCTLVINQGVSSSSNSNDVEYSEKVVVLKSTVPNTTETVEPEDPNDEPTTNVIIGKTTITYPDPPYFIWMNNAQPPKWGNNGETLILKLIQIYDTVYATVMHNSQVVDDLNNEVKQTISNGGEDTGN